MSVIKCFDVVDMVTSDATERFSPVWKLDNSKISILKQYCEAIDLMVNEFECHSLEVEVDEITMDISIDIEFDELTIEDSHHVFYDLANRAIKLALLSNNDKVVVRFVFPSIWDKCC